MSSPNKINVGIVGSVGRGSGFRAGLEANDVNIKAVCDIQAEKLEENQTVLGADERYTDYAEMLDKASLDAVIIGTPMPIHVDQSMHALSQGVHVLSEVTAAVSVEECKKLVRVCQESDAIYMMAENSCYTRQNMVIKELVRQGLFGQVYYAEGEYLHELKELNEITKWRRKWQSGIDGITYGTHSLGPILQWMGNDRVVSVCCQGSGRHYKDPRGDNYAQDTSIMLCKTANGALIKIRVDMISDRPHAMTNYQLQGTDGAYESARSADEHNKIWLRELNKECQWLDLQSLIDIDALAERFVPEMWRNPSEKALQAGHGGGDYFIINDWVRSIKGEIACPIGIHQAMDMTLPGLISQQSIQQQGQWLEVPDSRKW